LRKDTGIDTEEIAASAAPTAAGSYDEILKSSALIGVSQVLSILVRIVRTKMMAVLLGPAGIGLMGVLGVIEELASSIAGMGLRMSGVRQIADAAGRNDRELIVRTVTALRRVSLFLGCVGAVGLLVFCDQIATITFGNSDYAFAVALLGLAVLFRLVSNAQTAVIQGLHRISDLAKLEPLGALLGAIVGVAIVYVYGEAGIAPAAVASAGLALVVSWFFSRRVMLGPRLPATAEIRGEALGLLRLGMAFMSQGLMTIGSGYLIRMIVLRATGLEEAGLYQAAVALGVLYVGIVLQAQLLDFYPRLVGVATDNAACNRLINEQAHVSMLLAAPGVAGTMALAPLLVPAFYSSAFAGAVPLVNWVCMGMVLRVLAWPLGMMMLAKDTQRLFIISEFTWTSFSVVLAWALVHHAGLNGAGFAFFGAELFHILMTYLIARHLSGFRWEWKNRKIGLALMAVVTALMAASYALPTAWAVGTGLLIAIVSGLVSLRLLVQEVSTERLPARLRRLLGYFGASSGVSRGSVVGAHGRVRFGDPDAIASDGSKRAIGAEPPVPIVSIIVNNFNYARFLNQSVNSALAQTYPRTEVIVVDDASTDGSQELIRSFGDRVVPVLQAKNGGQGAAMNAGFLACKGDVIIFLDADDYLYPRVAETVASLYKAGVGIIQYRLHLVDEDGRIIDLYPPREIRFDNGDVRKKLTETGRFEGTVTSGLAFGRKALAAVLPIPANRFRIAADGYLVTAVPFHGNVLAIEQPLGAYRRHGGSLWSTASTMAGRFRRSFLHDANRYRELASRASAHGLRSSDQPGLRDYQHVSLRLGSFLLDPGNHPIPHDSRLALGFHGVAAAARASLPLRFRVLLGIWFLALGILPIAQSRMLFRWAYEPGARPSPVGRALKWLREPGVR
jgi:enterobacterial common antigen flippase